MREVLCAECGWHGRIEGKLTCPGCGSAGGLPRAGKSRVIGSAGPVEFMGRDAGGPAWNFPVLLDTDILWVIPKKGARTANATTASRSRGDRTMASVVEHHKAGLSASQVALKMGWSATTGARNVRKWLARAREQGLI
jgi:hypothetical protein